MTETFILTYVNITPGDNMRRLKKFGKKLEKEIERFERTVMYLWVL